MPNRFRATCAIPILSIARWRGADCYFTWPRTTGYGLPTGASFTAPMWMVPAIYCKPRAMQGWIVSFTLVLSVASGCLVQVMQARLQRVMKIVQYRFKT